MEYFNYSPEKQAALDIIRAKALDVLPNRFKFLQAAS